MSAIFLFVYLKMTNFQSYSDIPSAPPPENPQVGYHLGVVQAKRRGLIKIIKIMKILSWLNACSRGISVATGISSVAMFATFIEIPVSAALGAISMTGVISSGIISVLKKSIKRNLRK